MAKSSPQTNYFKIAYSFKKIKDAIFLILFVASIVFSFLKIHYLIDAVSIMMLVALTVFDYIIEDYQENAELERRKDFLDNSFGSNMCVENSVEYYNNDEINHGMYKMLVNIFENTLFSFEISEKMKKKALMKNIPIAIIVVALAMYGFVQSRVALPFLQLFISGYFLKNLIVIYKYNSKLKKIYDDIISLFDQSNSKDNKIFKKSEAKILKIYIEYESNITHSKLFLDSKLFDKHNKEISSKWDNFKDKYKII